jgi:hypothetical protein
MLYRRRADSKVLSEHGVIGQVVAADSGPRILSSVIANELPRAA